MNSERAGVLIVLEGTDGSGKGTQFELLQKRLKASGYDVSAFDFPQYQKPSSYFIKRYLNGDYGPLEAVSPYICSLFYALDRYEAAPQIEADLNAGKIVICNRFSGSNMAHQGAKISNAEERRGYFIWLDNLEFELLRIPRPDVSFILRVPAKIAQGLIAQKPQRSYTDSTHDIHEASLDHLQRSVEVYDDLAKLFPKDFQRLDCVRSGNIMSVEAVHNLLWEKILPLLPALGEPAVEPAPTSKASVAATLEPVSQVATVEASALLAPKLLSYGWVERSAQSATFDFFTPTGLTTEAKNHYESEIGKILKLHAEVIQKLAAHLTTGGEQLAGNEYAAWQQKVQAESATVARAVLPVAVISTYGYAAAAIPNDFVQELSNDDLAEARTAATLLAHNTNLGAIKTPVARAKPTATLLLGNHSGPTADVTLVDAWPRNELDLLPELIYRHSSLPLGALREAVAKWPYDRKLESFEERLSQQHKNALGKARYSWELLSSYDTFCQIQKKLGGKMVLEAQELTPRFGFEVPKLIEQAGLTDQFEQCFALSLELHSQLQKASHALEARYATLFGHRLHWKMTCTAQQLAGMHQWPAGNPELARLLGLMHEKLLQAHPLLGEVIRQRLLELNPDDDQSP